MKLYWSLRMKRLRSGCGSGCTLMPTFGYRTHVVAELGLLESEHHQLPQRIQRQEHVGIEIGDDALARAP